MSTFMRRNALVGSAAMLSLLAALHAPVSLAAEGLPSAEAFPSDAAADKQAPQTKVKAAAGQQMDHRTMNHNGMDHENMMDKQDGAEAEAGSNHDH